MANTSMVTSSVITATSQHKRDYSEKIRRFNSEMTKMLALVEGSTLDAWGKPAYSGKGMIGKKGVKRLDPEWATYTPIDIMYLATGGSSTTAVIADTTVWQTGDKVVNTTTSEVGIVSALASPTTLTIQAVTGDTWSCSAGQWICMLSSTYEEGTSRYNTVTNELTTNKTYLETFREGISIADTVKRTPQYTEEGMLERYNTDKMMQTLQKLENSYWHSKKATAGTTATTIGGVAYSLYSMQGVLDYAGTAIDMGGSFNWETFNTTLFPQMPKFIKPKEVVYAAMGRKIASVMNQWAQNSYLTMGENAGEMKFGKKVKSYIMGGNLNVEPLVLENFDSGGYEDSIVFFQSSDLEYLFMEGMDLNIRENAQLPATMGTTNIIEGTTGLRSWSNGAAIKWVKNCLSAG